MTAPRRAAILSRYDELPEEIRVYFDNFPRLAREFPWDVSISYIFSLVETAHNRTVYGGVVKRHKVHSTMAWTALDNHHMTRNGFRELYRKIFGQPLPDEIVESITRAEKIRDKILHGKGASDNDKRQAVMDVLNYAESYNEEIYRIAKFRPFGSMQGFKGRAKSHDRSTSRWILMGMGFSLG